MSKFLDGTSLYTGINSGLNNTYSILSNQFSNGVTLENLSSKDATNALNSNSLSANFKQYLQSNFSTLDKDGDGTISSTEMTDLTDSLSNSGMTREQLTQLGTSNGISSSLLNTVLSHFDEIDVNKDGKVTNSEIKAYGIDSSFENQKTKDINHMIANMSTFYGDSESSVEDSGSLLDYKYLQEEKES